MLVEGTKREDQTVPKEDVQEFPVESGFEDATKDLEVNNDNI